MNTIEIILFAIFCFISGAMVGVMISYILQMDYEVDNINKELENDEQETRSIVKE